MSRNVVIISDMPRALPRPKSISNSRLRRKPSLMQMASALGRSQ